jgi:hypothetical protein
MLRRLLRRTFDPGRPLLYENQYALALLTVVVLLGSLAIVAWVELR